MWHVRCFNVLDFYIRLGILSSKPATILGRLPHFTCEGPTVAVIVINESELKASQGLQIRILVVENNNTFIDFAT
jgi:hypothetical protein